ESVVKKLIAADRPVKGARVAILGFTFKENCPDTRNTKVIDIYRELGEYGITPMVVDTTADASEAERLYGIQFASMSDIRDMDAVIVAVAHDEFLKLSKADIDGFFNKNNKIRVLADIKGLFDKSEYSDTDYIYWRL
nr:nucleotide sugar dehydrogenase [Lachnospiraceae bacterium]